MSCLGSEELSYLHHSPSDTSLEERGEGERGGQERGGGGERERERERERVGDNLN